MEDFTAEELREMIADIDKDLAAGVSTEGDLATLRTLKERLERRLVIMQRQRPSP